jgi:hypothetical protein
MSTTCSEENLHAVFKAYDVRGTVPDQLDEDLASAAGSAFVEVVGEKAIVVGYDMRPSSPDLAGAFADGATAAGADVTMIGLASTDQLYFASGHLGLPGAMFTASHNPAQYNGIKLCRAHAQPVGRDTGLTEIRDRVAAGITPRGGASGSVVSHDVLQAYAAHLLSLAPVTGRKLKVVIDAGNGMAGHTAPAVFDRIADQVDVVPMYFELDGTFPNHEANPIDPANLVDLQEAVRAEGADAGLAFDGDADRCFVVDERGDAVSPSAITALVAARELVAAAHARLDAEAVPRTTERVRVDAAMLREHALERGGVLHRVPLHVDRVEDAVVDPVDDAERLRGVVPARVRAPRLRHARRVAREHDVVRQALEPPLDVRLELEARAAAVPEQFRDLDAAVLGRVVRDVHHVVVHALQPLARLGERGAGHREHEGEGEQACGHQRTSGVAARSRRSSWIRWSTTRIMFSRPCARPGSVR